MLAGKNCVVTAGSGGIGKGIVRAFLKEGAFVFFSGRSAGSVNPVVQEFNAEGFTNVQGVIADVSTLDGATAFFTEVAATGKEIDVLVNNLGVFNSGDFFNYTDEEWMAFYSTNVLSTVRFCRHYMKPMLERNRGRVIIISSEASMRSIPDMIPYCTTKAAQINLARGLAELTKGTNVTVNSLLPGPTATEGVLGDYMDGLVASGLGATKEAAVAAYFKDREPTSLLQRFLTVEEIGNVAAFLASDLSSGINGASQRVEGGIIRHL
jgi:NAD(P)-dependent dehydrogenase (short-subunit alcohol dehydrogenase family)